MFPMAFKGYISFPLKSLILCLKTKLLGYGLKKHGNNIAKLVGVAIECTDIKYDVRICKCSSLALSKTSWI